MLLLCEEVGMKLLIRHSGDKKSAEQSPPHSLNKAYFCGQITLKVCPYLIKPDL